MRGPRLGITVPLLALLLVPLSIKADEDQEKRFAKFEKTLNNVKLVGNFTVVGSDNDGPLAKEEYTITKVEKMEEGDFWKIHARIKYGGQDVTLPLPLEVKWAGNTPVITLDKILIPGLGTFSARVVIINGKYAGTWTHGENGGHLFGTIKKNEPKKEPKK